MPDGIRSCPSEWFQQTSSRGVKRMARLAGAGERNGLWPRRERKPLSPLLHNRLQQIHHLLRTVKPATAIAPATPERPCLLVRPQLAPPQQRRVGIQPDGIAAPPQHRGRCRDAGKQIDHHQSVVAPVPCEADQTAQGGIVPLGISPRRIQSQKDQNPAPMPPTSRQPPTEASVGTDAGVRPPDGPG